MFDDDEWEGAEEDLVQNGAALEAHYAQRLPPLFEAVKFYEGAYREADKLDLTLDLSDHFLVPQNVQTLFDFLETSQVTALKLHVSDTSGNNFGDIIPSLFNKLKGTNLKRLKLSSQTNAWDVISCLAAVLGSTKIIDVHITGNGSPRSSGAVHDTLNLLPSTSLSHLRISDCRIAEEATVTALFSTLPDTVITHLELSQCLWEVSLKGLGESLRKSKLKVLKLDSNFITDTGVDNLVSALVSSPVTELSLLWNDISGANILGSRLRETNIRSLNLSANYIKHSQMFSFPDFLRATNITSLDLSYCGLSDEVGKLLMESLKCLNVSKLCMMRNELGLATISEFAKMVKGSGLKDVFFNMCPLPDEAGSILARCLEDSEVKNIGLPCGTGFLASFFGEAKCSKINYLSLGSLGWRIESKSLEIIAKSLMSTTITQLKLSGCCIGNRVATLAACLKHTEITALCLGMNNIRDEGAEILAEFIPESKLNRLNVERNGITGYGAKCLVSCLKNTSLYSLDLDDNRLSSADLEELADIIKDTFVVGLSAKSRGTQERVKSLALATAIWKNRSSVDALSKSFRKIVSESGNFFCFDEKKHVVAEFLEERLQFYQTIVDQPSAIGALAQCDTSFCGWKKTSELLLENFPHQFALFMAQEIEAPVSEHVQLLRRTETLGLSRLVRALLLNRPLLTVDEEKGILHPFAYELLHKYKLPLVNLGVEPNGVNKIIDYFSENEFDGGSDIIDILRSMKAKVQ